MDRGQIEVDVEIEQTSPRSYWLTVHYRDTVHWYGSTMERSSTFVWAPLPSLARRWAQSKARRLAVNRVRRRSY